MAFPTRLNALLALLGLLSLATAALAVDLIDRPLGAAAEVLDWPPNCKSCTSYERKRTRVAVLLATSGGAA